MTERALLTGPTGFIGHHLAHALQQRGVEVTCLIRRSSNLAGLQDAGISLAYGDLRDPESLQDPLACVDVVYHLAALTKAASPEAFYAVNKTGTRNLAAACARCESPPTLVLVSSLSAAGPSPDDRPRTERDPPAPVSHYGRSKLAGERAAGAYAGELPITVVRPPTVFGERDRDALEWFRWVARGLHPMPVAATRRYSLIHAGDLSDFLLLVASRGERLPSPDASPGAPGLGLYYLSYGEHPTYAELGRRIAAALGRRRVWTFPIPQVATTVMAALAEAGARVRGRPPGIVNRDKAREGAAGSWTCSTEKARRQLGFTPGSTLEDRLRQTALWYRSEGWL